MTDNIFEKMTEEERIFAWMYMIFNRDKILEKTEKWMKEAEEAGMTLAEYLETINPLNDKKGRINNMLILPIKKKWYDMIYSGEKKEEYRKLSPYYEARFKNLWQGSLIGFDAKRNIIFRNGYSRRSPSFIATVTLDIGEGKTEWGAEPGKEYYVLKIHSIDELPRWIGKRCNDCRNEKCKSLGKLPKRYDCALWQSQAENYSIKMVTNAEEAEEYQISENISKGFEEFTKMMFKQG